MTTTYGRGKGASGGIGIYNGGGNGFGGGNGGGSNGGSVKYGGGNYSKGRDYGRSRYIRIQSLHIRHSVHMDDGKTRCGIYVYGPSPAGDVTCMNCLVQQRL